VLGLQGPKDNALAAASKRRIEMEDCLTVADLLEREGRPWTDIVGREAAFDDEPAGNVPVQRQDVSERLDLAAMARKGTERRGKRGPAADEWRFAPLGTGSRCRMQRFWRWQACRIGRPGIPFVGRRGHDRQQ
jgi:hypothetical protein